MVSSFQFTREVRLSLTHRTRTEMTDRNGLPRGQVHSVSVRSVGVLSQLQSALRVIAVHHLVEIGDLA